MPAVKRFAQRLDEPGADKDHAERENEVRYLKDGSLARVKSLTLCGSRSISPQWDSPYQFAAPVKTSNGRR